MLILLGRYFCLCAVKKAVNSEKSCICFGSSDNISCASNQLGAGVSVKKLFCKQGAQLVGHIHTIKDGNGVAVPPQRLCYSYQMLISVVKASTIMQYQPALQGKLKKFLLLHIGKLSTNSRKGPSL